MTTKQEELMLFHQQFLQSPIGRRIGVLLEEHEKNIIDYIANRSHDPSPDSSSQIRYYAVQLQETRKIRKLIYDIDTFVAKST